jgi:hypothetical protein
MKQALTRRKSCPLCNKAKITASRDVVLKNQILKQQVYCINRATDPHTATASANTNNNKKRKATSNEKCSWTGKYDDLRAHLNVCEYEVIDCSNDGCVDKLERREIETHRQVCNHRIAQCDHCNADIKATAMPDHLQRCPSIQVTCECNVICTRQSIAGHRERDCPLTEVPCEVIGCNVKVMRKDYAKHGNEAAQEHVRLLSATVQTLANLVESKPIQVKWRITSIAGGLKKYDSPRFDAFLNGNHKLYMQARIEGNQLALYLHKDIAMSADKSTLDISGSSFTVSKAGLPDTKKTYSNAALVRPPYWTNGFPSFLADMTPYIDDDGINVTLDLKLSKEQQQPIIL